MQSVSQRGGRTAGTDGDWGSRGGIHWAESLFDQEDPALCLAMARELGGTALGVRDTNEGPIAGQAKGTDLDAELGMSAQAFPSGYERWMGAILDQEDPALCLAVALEQGKSPWQAWQKHIRLTVTVVPTRPAEIEAGEPSQV